MNQNAKKVATIAETYYGVERILGDSPKIKVLRDRIIGIAPTDASVIIYGETGVGKELVAQALHEHSKRANGPFVPVDLSTLAPTIVESELFGVVKGAYTDAKTRNGYIARAHKGTLFLDEIQNLQIGVQEKLLRFLDNGQYRMVGGSQDYAPDVRIITASNQNLEKLVNGGGFNNGLYYRINTVPLQIPPLRDRKDDIRLLAEYYCEVYSLKYGKSLALLEDALSHLQQFKWPGNVRELRSTIESAVVLKDAPNMPESKIERVPLQIADFEAVFSARQFNPEYSMPTSHKLEDAPEDSAPTNLRLERIERDHIISVVKKYGLNKARAAHELGISNKTLTHKLRRF